MAQGIHLRKYGVEATVDFELYEVDGIDLRTDWTPAAADCEVMKDGGASTQCTNTATDEGSTYSIVLTATEMEAARIVLKIVDAATKAFLDKVVIIETYGHASAQHAFDLDTATQGVDVTKWTGETTIDGETLLSALSVILAACGGKISGSEDNTPVIRSADDTADRITATTDANGNRTAVTLNGAT